MRCVNGGGRPAASGRSRLAWIAIVMVAFLALPGYAPAAKLIGGAEQAAVKQAFSSLRAHRHELIASIRASTVSPSWVVVKSVAPQRDRTSSAQTAIKLVSTYFHLVGGRPRAGRPSGAALADLSAPFQVAIVYKGSGSETVHYLQLYRSACAGAGGYVNQQSETVSPMSWSVRYVVDLDSLQAAVQSPQGATLLPSVAFAPAGSQLSAIETLTRSAVDQGCFGNPTNFSCITAYHLSGAGADGDLSFDPGLGTEIGIPMTGRNTGQCSPDDYTIGPSLWDGGASTALVGRLGLLGLLGEALPRNPYAPVRVSWPANSALGEQGFLVSPCQGMTASCTDQLNWHGSVQLEAVGRG